MNPIRILSIRDIFRTEGTLARVYFNGDLFGFNCEDPDRGINNDWTPEQVAAVKIPKVTCIGIGLYELGLRDSPKHGLDTVYLKNVTGFQFIDVHKGNTPRDTEGCQLPGLHRDISKLMVTKSELADAWLDKQLIPHLKAGGLATWEIRRDPTAWALAPFNPARLTSTPRVL